MKGPQVWELRHDRIMMIEILHQHGHQNEPRLGDAQTK